MKADFVATWERARREADIEIVAAEQRLSDLAAEHRRFMADWNARRERAKRDREDAVRSKRSAVFALKTGREPR